MSRPTDPLRLTVIVALTLLAGIKLLFWLRNDQRHAEARPIGTASITGQAVDDTGQAIGGARLTVSGEVASFQLSVLSDDRGRFTAASLPAGVYQISGSKDGYLGGRSNPFRVRSGFLPETTTIRVTDAQQLEGIVITLTRGAVLSGIVYDERGQPARNHQVRVMRREPRWEDVAYTDAAPLASTDERGRYRITGLSADTYYLMASLGRGMSARVYFPSALRIKDATPVQIGVAEERIDLDLHARAVPTSTVGGVATHANASPAAGIRVDLVAAGGTEPDARHFVTTAGADGAFVFTDVAPDDYLVIAHGQRTGGWATGESTHVWARVGVTSDGSRPLNVPLTVVPGMTISGRVNVDPLDGTAAPKLDGGFLFLLAGDARSDAWLGAGDRPAARLDANGALTFRDVPPGQYVLTERFLDRPWRIESAVQQDRDLLDTPFEIKAGEDVGGLVVTLVDRAAQVEGVARDGSGAPLANRLVVAFPAESRLWQRGLRRANAGQTAADGRFTIAGLPAGNYLLAYASTPEIGQFNMDWGTTAFYRRLADRAVRITLSRGERRVQDLTIR